MREFREGLQTALSGFAWMEADARAVRARIAAEGEHAARRLPRWGVILAALLILALAGAALAATNAFGILERLFPNGAPGERTQKLVAPVGRTYGEGDNAFTIEEYVFDGRELQVDWQARTAGDGLVLFAASALSADAEQELLAFGNSSGLYLHEYAPLGGEYGAVWDGYTAGSFAGGLQTEPFTATLQVWFLRPTAPIADWEEIVPGEEIVEPMFVESGSGTLESILAYEPVLRIDGKGGPTFASLEDMPEGMGAIEYYASLGFYDIIETYELSLPVVPDAEAIASTRIAGQTAFETEYYRIEFTRAEFNAAGTDLRWYIQSRTGLPFEKDWVYMLDYAICANGEELPLERGGGGGADFYECEAWGGPLAEMPETVTITPRAGNRMQRTGADARVPRDADFPAMTLTLEPVRLAQGRS